MPNKPPGDRSGQGAASIMRHIKADAVRAGESGADTEARLSRGSATVLVVDDTEAARYSLARSLRVSGFNTIEAATGTDALALAATASAVVLDVNLPDVNGIAVCHALRADERTSRRPIVLISTVFDSWAHRESGRTAGADEYLSPPLDPRVLASVLDRLLARRP